MAELKALTTADPFYYNATLGVAGGHLTITDGQLAFVDCYSSVKTKWRYGAVPAGDHIGIVPAGGTHTIPRDPVAKPGESWTIYLTPTADTELSAMGHNNAGFRG